MGADNFSWGMRSRGEDEYDAKIRAEHARYEAALREIAAGKIASDNENPMGEGHSMAGRFLTIAQRALQTGGKVDG